MLLSTKIARNSVAGGLAMLFQVVTRLAIIPFVLSYISLAEYGLWSFCFVVLSYAGADLGFSKSYIKYTANYAVQGRQDKINSLLSTGILCTGLLSLGFYFGLWQVLPFILNHIDISVQMRDLVSFMVLLTAAAFLLDLVSVFFRSILEGLQKAGLTQYIGVGASCLELVLIFGLLPGNGVRGLMYAYMSKTLLKLAAFAGLAFRLHPGLRLGPELVRRQAFQDIFIVEGRIRGLGMLTVFLNSLDRLLITALVGLSGTGLFEIARKFPFAAKNAVGGAFWTLFPAASDLGGWWSEIHIVSTWIKFRFYCSLLYSSLVIACAPVAVWAFYRWLNGDQGYLAGFFCWLSFAFTLLPIWSWMQKYPAAKDRLQGKKLRQLYVQACRHITLLNGILFAFLPAIGEHLLRAWVGREYLSAAPVLSLLALGYFFQQSTCPVSLIFRGLNCSGREAEFMLVTLGLSLVWLPFASWMWGIWGTALAVSAVSVVACIYYLYRSNLAFELEWSAYIYLVVTPLWVPLSCSMLLKSILLFFPTLGRISTLFEVLLAGILYLGLVLSLLQIFVFDSQEKAIVYEFIARAIKSK